MVILIKKYKVSKVGLVFISRTEHSYTHYFSSLRYYLVEFEHYVSSSGSHCSPYTFSVPYDIYKYSYFKFTHCCIRVSTSLEKGILSFKYDSPSCSIKWMKNNIHLIFSYSASIEDVKSDSKFIWHTQRYKLVREYYEKPIFAHPPLSLLVYIVLIVKMFRGRGPVFRTLSK